MARAPFCNCTLRGEGPVTSPNVWQMKPRPQFRRNRSGRSAGGVWKLQNRCVFPIAFPKDCCGGCKFGIPERATPEVGAVPLAGRFRETSRPGRSFLWRRLTSPKHCLASEPGAESSTWADRTWLGTITQAGDRLFCATWIRQTPTTGMGDRGRGERSGGPGLSEQH